MSDKKRYLVTGASGPLGRLVVNALLDAGITTYPAVAMPQFDSQSIPLIAEHGFT